MGASTDVPPQLWFYDGDDMVAERSASTVPRIGETVGLLGKRWRVVSVDYLYPVPGSMSYNAGEREPIVSIHIARGD